MRVLFYDCAGVRNIKNRALHIVAQNSANG